jgi:phage major head subunit gpT-like protein
MTYEAMRNDDLGGLGVALEESVEAHLGVEADSLVALLSGNGATAPDGQPLFHSSHNNSTAAAMTVDGLAAAVKLLRQQKSIGGRLIAQDPGYLLVGPEREAEAAALLSDLWQATTAEDVNPWRNLQLLVEPSLSGLTYYMVASGPRKPFELGQLVGLPRVQQEEDFSTSSVRFKSESAHGCAVADHRPLVRCTAPAS